LLCLYLFALPVYIPHHLAKECKVADVLRIRLIRALIAQVDITSVMYVLQLLLEVKVVGLGTHARVA
jgi:hypothetical protein